jgi:MFS superfamily sulfate permease-like transporter
MRLRLFDSLRPLNRSAAVRDSIAGVTLASMNIPQVLGYTRIAGTPVVTGLYTVLLPLVAFAAFGSSRHLVVAADSATAAIFSSSLSQMAAPGSEKYMALVGMVALLTAGFLLVARVVQLGFLADFLSRTVLVGFLTGVGTLGMIDATGLRDIRRESPGEFYLATITAAVVVAVGVEQGILLAMALSLFRHVRHSYRPHTMVWAPRRRGPLAPGADDAWRGD